MTQSHIENDDIITSNTQVQSNNSDAAAGFSVADEELDFKVIEEEEEDNNTGHRLQTFNPENDGEDNYFDEQYFQE